MYHSFASVRWSSITSAMGQARCHTLIEVNIMQVFGLGAVKMRCFNTMKRTEPSIMVMDKAMIVTSVEAPFTNTITATTMRAALC